MKCRVCDREECNMLELRCRTHEPHESTCPACTAVRDCRAHAVDWRARALAAEQQILDAKHRLSHFPGLRDACELRDLDLYDRPLVDLISSCEGWSHEALRHLEAMTIDNNRLTEALAVASASKVEAWAQAERLTLDNNRLREALAVAGIQEAQC